MKSGYSDLNPTEHPEGYITDSIKADSITDDSKPLTDDIQLTFVSLPDIATITFNIELLNLTGSQSRIFEITSSVSRILAEFDVYYTIYDMHLLKFPVGDQMEQYVEITYFMRNLQINGEKVRIKYNGKSHTPPSH